MLKYCTLWVVVGTFLLTAVLVGIGIGYGASNLNHIEHLQRDEAHHYLSMQGAVSNISDELEALKLLVNTSLVSTTSLLDEVNAASLSVATCYTLPAALALQAEERALHYRVRRILCDVFPGACGGNGLAELAVANNSTMLIANPSAATLEGIYMDVLWARVRKAMLDSKLYTPQHVCGTWTTPCAPPTINDAPRCVDVALWVHLAETYGRSPNSVWAHWQRSLVVPDACHNIKRVETAITSDRLNVNYLFGIFVGNLATSKHANPNDIFFNVLKDDDFRLLIKYTHDFVPFYRDLRLNTVWPKIRQFAVAKGVYLFKSFITGSISNVNGHLNNHNTASLASNRALLNALSKGLSVGYQPSAALITEFVDAQNALRAELLTYRAYLVAESAHVDYKPNVAGETIYSLSTNGMSCIGNLLQWTFGYDLVDAMNYLKDEGEAARDEGVALLTQALPDYLGLNLTWAHFYCPTGSDPLCVAACSGASGATLCPWALQQSGSGVTDEGIAPDYCTFDPLLGTAPYLRDIESHALRVTEVAARLSRDPEPPAFILWGGAAFSLSCIRWGGSSAFVFPHVENYNGFTHMLGIDPSITRGHELLVFAHEWMHAMQFSQDATRRRSPWMQGLAYGPSLAGALDDYFGAASEGGAVFMERIGFDQFGQLYRPESALVNGTRHLWHSSFRMGRIVPRLAMDAGVWTPQQAADWHRGISGFGVSLADLFGLQRESFFIANLKTAASGNDRWYASGYYIFRRAYDRILAECSPQSIAAGAHTIMYDVQKSPYIVSVLNVEHVISKFIADGCTLPYDPYKR